jgi:hypothetical protein
LNRNTQGLGLFSTWGLIILSILLIIAILLQLIIVPDRGWIPAITSYYSIDTSSSFLSDFCGVVYFLQVPLLLVLFTCLHDYSSVSLKIFSRISFSLIISFTILRTLSYVSELTVNSFNFQVCDDDCILYYTHSIIQKTIFSVDAIAMTVFMGLAELFIIPVFSKLNKIEKRIRYILTIAGISSLISALMFISDKPVIFEFWSLFHLILFTVVLILLVKFFKQSV